MIGGRFQKDQRLDLTGARVLVVEDEYYIADDLKRTLEAAGASVVGPYSSVDTANAAIDAGAFDCAVIDLNLNGESALCLADRLAAKGKSFAIATGYGSGEIPGQHGAVPRLEKPFEPDAVLELVSRIGCARVS